MSVEPRSSQVSLSVEEVRKLALLARLDLSDDEVASVAPQLDSILAFVEQLAELDTTGVEPNFGIFWQCFQGKVTYFIRQI